MDKPFSWTYTKLKNFETCPAKHKAVDIDKKFKDDGISLKWGNYVHESFAKAIRLKCDLIGPRAALPQDLVDLGWQAWIDKVASFLDDKGKLYVEQQYAVDKDYRATEWYGADVWHRCVADVVYLNEPADLAVVWDWKTNKKPMEDSIQLFCTAKVIFARFPSVQTVITRFAWLSLTGKDANNPLPQTKEKFTRQDMIEFWPEILQRVNQYEHALATDTFHTNPSGLCKKHCPVSSCGYYGKGAFHG